MTCVGAGVGLATGAVVGLPTVGELVENGIEARGTGAGAGLTRTGAEVGLRVGLLPRVLETGIIVGDPPPPPPPPPLLTVKWLDVGCRVG